MNDLMHLLSSMVNGWLWVLFFCSFCKSKLHLRHLVEILFITVTMILGFYGIDPILVPLVCAVELALIEFLLNKHIESKVEMWSKIVFSFAVSKIIVIFAMSGFFLSIRTVIPNSSDYGITVIAAGVQITLGASAILIFSRIETKFLFARRSIKVITVLGSLIWVVVAAFRLPYAPPNRILYFYMLAILILLVILGIAWIHYDYKVDKQERLHRHHISELQRTTHQYKEIVPALTRQLKTLKEVHTESELPIAHIDMDAALKELESLSAVSIQKSAHEFAVQQTFGTTGLTFLDAQIVNEQIAACEKNIAFRCVVCHPIDQILSGDFTQFDLQQLIGDLYRNAIRAIEENGLGSGEILLILGIVHGSYQIKICDMGVPFSPSVLARLGERGVSTTGGGNGYTDIFEVLKKCSASLKITQGGDVSGYTKRIEITMDGRGMLEIETETLHKICPLPDSALNAMPL